MIAAKRKTVARYFKPQPVAPAIKGVHPAIPASMETVREADLHAEKIRLIMRLRKQGITDTRTLGAIEQTPREQFVDAQFIDRAYDDNALPIAMEQTISMPSVVALMTQALDVKPTHAVLEIGTGSGYQAAVLARMARRVHTIERHRPLAEQARARFDRMKLRNITQHVGDGGKGWAHAAPYERIIVTCAAPEIPMELLHQLAIGGVMIVPVGPHVADQQLLKLTRVAEDEVRKETLAPVRFVPLVSE
jgi:protein-L-isoaspartate(D-aspartate) O-methyltransferase